MAIFRPASGKWAVRGLTSLYYGTASDLSVPSDYDGDNDDGCAVFRPSSGLWAIRAVTKAYFGTTGDLPVTR